MWARLCFKISQPEVRTAWPYASFSKNFIHLAPGSEFNNVFYGLFLFTSNNIKEEKLGGKFSLFPYGYSNRAKLNYSQFP